MDEKQIQAYRYCRKIAREHYENFPVASILMPARLRPHVAAIYAFARTADDYSDIDHDRNKILDWRRQLHACTNAPPENPIFIALAHTIQKFDLPIIWLDNLLTAFLQDLDKTRYSDFDELLNYCHYSANPVGRMLLWIFGIRSEKAMIASDAITSALQLTNFWQDISIDLKNDRIYIPEVLLNKYGITGQALMGQKIPPDFGRLLKELVDFTAALFEDGRELFLQVNGRLALELKLTYSGGLQTLKKVENLSEDVFFNRPKLHGMDWLKILLKSFFN